MKKKKENKQNFPVPQTAQALVPPEPVLEIIEGPEEGVLYRLTGTEITIGRGKENDIVLDDSRVSRLHALINIEEGRFLLKDLESQNGIEVNGKMVTLCELDHGDKVKIGETTFQIDIPEYEEQISEGMSYEDVDDLGPLQPRSFKLIPFVLLGICALAIYWALTPGVQQDSPKQIQREPFSLPPATPQDRPISDNVGTRIQQENLISANHLYQKGFRELMARNYLRSINFLEAALTLYPNHQAAKQKLQRAHEEIATSIDEAFQLGRRYFENHHWQRAIFHFERAKLLLGKKTDSQTYVEADRLAEEARARLAPPLIRTGEEFQ